MGAWHAPIYLLDLFFSCIGFFVSCTRPNFNNTSTGLKEGGGMFRNRIAVSFYDRRFGLGFRRDGKFSLHIDTPLKLRETDMIRYFTEILLYLVP